MTKPDHITGFKDEYLSGTHLAHGSGKMSHSTKARDAKRFLEKQELLSASNDAVERKNWTSAKGRSPENSLTQRRNSDGINQTQSFVEKRRQSMASAEQLIKLNPSSYSSATKTRQTGSNMYSVRLPAQSQVPRNQREVL